MQNLRLHQIDAGDHLRDRMLHLDARVHLDEVKTAVLIHQELDGAGIHIADFARDILQASRRSARALFGVTCKDGASSISF